MAWCSAVAVGHSGAMPTASALRPLSWAGMPDHGVVAAVGYGSRHGQPVLHRGMPSAWLTLVLTTGGEPLLLRGPVDHAPGTAQPLRTSLAGLQGRATWVEQSGEQCGVQLALHPLAARSLLGVPAAELDPVGADAVAVLPALAGLQERLAAVVPPQQADALRDWCSERPNLPAVAARPPREEVRHAWRLVARSHGRVRIEEVARQCQLSGRQLRTLVRRELGVGPKHLARLARLDHAVSRMATGADPTLSATAAACGYADHSHLDAEFAALVGCAPSTWLQEERRNIQDGGHRAPHTGAHD